MSKIKPVIAIGVIVAAITVLIFFIVTTSPIKSIDWLGLIFVLFSEIVLFSCTTYLLSKQASSSKRIFQTAEIFVLVIYWILTATIVLLKDIFSSSQQFIFVNVTLIGIISILIVIMDNVISKIQNSDSITIDSLILIQDIEKRLYEMQTSTQFSEHKSALSNIYELIKSSDGLYKSSVDIEILREVNNLENVLTRNSDDIKNSIEESIANISLFLNLRNTEIIQGRRGGI